MRQLSAWYVAIFILISLFFFRFSYFSFYRKIKKEGFLLKKRGIFFKVPPWGMSELIWLFLNLWFVMKINFWRMSQLIWLFLNQWFVMKISFWGMSQLIWVFWKEIFFDKKEIFFGVPPPAQCSRGIQHKLAEAASIAFHHYHHRHRASTIGI